MTTEMKRVFVCSPLKQRNGFTIDQHLELAERLSRAVVLAGHAPFTPHLLYPLFLHEDDPAERAAGIACGVEFLKTCHEVWVFGTGPDVWSEGMKHEVALAKQFGKTVRCAPVEWADITLEA